MDERLSKPSVKTRTSLRLVLMFLLLLGSGCERPSKTASPDAPPAQSDTSHVDASRVDSEKRDVPPSKREIAVLAGGCFWGMEQIIREIPGVLDTDVGYAGGAETNGTYEQVKTGRTQHAEAIRVVFDPERLAYGDLIRDWFFRMHDPTTKNRQGNDVGAQYRSAIFFQSETQKTVALQTIDEVNKSGLWSKPIVTEVTKFSTFVPAESYHQDYLEKNPGGYTCHFMRDPIH